MPSTFTIPLTTLPVGSQTFGPSNVPAADTAIVLTVDRTVAGGLNSLTTASFLQTDVQESLDGGVTWQDLGGMGTGGGFIGSKAGGPSAASSVQTNLIPGTSRKVRATVTVTGTPIAVAGTLATI